MDRFLKIAIYVYTYIVIPIETQVGVICQTSFENVEAEIGARTDVTEALAERAARKAHHRSSAF